MKPRLSLKKEGMQVLYLVAECSLLLCEACTFARIISSGFTLSTPITSRHTTIEISAIADGIVTKP